MTDRIIAVNSNCYHGYSIEEAIAGIRAAGFHYIELTATKGWTEHVFPDQSFQRLLEVKDELDEAGLIPFAMSGHTNLMDTARIPDFVKNIRLAHFFGARYIVSSIGEAHLKDNAVASNAVVAEHIRGFLPYLEKYDMILVLEVHGDHGKLHRAAALNEQHLIVIGNTHQLAQIGLSLGRDLLEHLGAVAHLHDAHTAAAVVHHLIADLLQHGLRHHGGAGGEIESTTVFHLVFLLFV